MGYSGDFRRTGYFGAELYDRAKEMRGHLAPPEARLWQALRAHRLGGFKFRRQHPIGQVIVDFCCVASRLVVEVDGDSHHGVAVEDKARDEYLVGFGYRVVRVRNEEVIRNLNAVLDRILVAVRGDDGAEQRGERNENS
jgi:very-short-patch-repair endonuclease